MEYLSVSAIAKKWGLSERTVRNYCANNKIKGAFLTGKTWNIPACATRPKKENAKYKTNNQLLNILREQKDLKLKGGIYHKTQVELTYNSNHIEGSKLTEDQTRYIFETNTLSKVNQTINVDDIIETTNHFKCIDYIIDIAEKQLTEKIIKNIHYTLKIGTSDSNISWFNVGDYKKLPNEVGGEQTCIPINVKTEMQKLIEEYESVKNKNLLDIISFHQKFETIHPFQDGNGRVGRLIMFKECLRNNIVPFVITNNLKMFYYRGLHEWNNEKGYLIDTIKTAQDEYKKHLDYFEISYKD